ncbi:MAG: KH domain-containing protein [Ignavibacteriae bacterium]|nr:KH domain-containing protein [Ignavibacteriota bacterium]
MREFLKFMAQHLVDNPDKVILDQEEKDGRILFKLQVAQPDIGKVIGKNGRTAQAMRTLLTAIAAKQGKRVILEIVD